MDEELHEVVWQMTRAAALLVLEQMRTLEDRVPDPSRRWEALRTMLHRFASTEPKG